MTSGNLSYAELILIRLNLRQDTPHSKNLAGWWLTVNQSLQGKWTEASKTFSELTQNLGLEDEQQVQETLELFATFAKKQSQQALQALETFIHKLEAEL